jgi:hypothetical protein
VNTRKTRTSACVGVVLAVALAALPAAGGGCSTKPQVLPSSGRRNPAPPDSVTIYQKQPKKYELLGEVTASREEGARWDDQGNANAGFDTLKQKAALLGANGLLLDPEVIPHERRAQSGYHDHFYRVGVRGTPGNATAVGQAIYVHEQ